MSISASPNVVVSSPPIAVSPPLRAQPIPVESREIVGTRVDGTNYAGAVDLITSWAREQASRYVCVSTVRTWLWKATTIETISRSSMLPDLVTSDGMPLVWALRLLGARRSERVYGPDLTPLVCERAAAEGLPVGFYGSSPGCLDAMVGNLRQAYPDLDVAYQCSPAVSRADRRRLSRRSRKFALRDGAQDYLVVNEVSGSRLDRSIRNAIERARATRSLRRDRERYELAIQATRDGIWDWDLLNNTVEYSPRWKEMLGYADEDIDGHPDAWFDLVHPGDLGRLRDRIQDHVTGQSPHFECEYRIRCQDGEYHWMLARGLAVENESGTPYRMAGFQSNISDRKRAELRLQRAALRDPLTGLDNRAQLMHGLEQALAASSRHETGVGILFLDLDNFKFINDSMGHSAGDHVLRIIARRLTVALREYDRIARFGGDEFTILIDDLVNVAVPVLLRRFRHGNARGPFPQCLRPARHLRRWQGKGSGGDLSQDCPGQFH
ncbi:MAG: diguanylate cyclase [Thermomicrobiales bacterium]